MRSVKLLTKTTILYLIFILVAFLATGVFITERTNKFLKEDAESFFKRREARALWDMEKNDPDFLQKRGLVKLDASALKNPNTYPKYRDTIVYVEELDEKILFRVKTILLHTGEGTFEYSIFKNINDFEEFRLSIINTIVRSFVILLVVLSLFSLILSGVLLRPFHRMLGMMARYKVGIPFAREDIPTTTSEFIEMKALFESMIARTEDDYRKLKEYTEDMAHEVQTPLAIIQIKAEALFSDESVTQRSAQALKAIYSEAMHLSKLGNALGLLTKIENGEYNRVVQIQTEPIISKHIESVREMFDLKGLQIEKHLDPEHTLNLDPLLFEVMLKNLIQNALKYSTPQGPVCIITTPSQLIVSNFGNPLPFDQSNLFKRFVGGRESKSTLGLGLAIVKKICDLNQLLICYTFGSGKHQFTVLPQGDS